MQWTYKDYLLTDDREKTDLDLVASWLAESYWASTRTRGQIETAVANSTCFSLFQDERQVGFFRALSDFAVYTYLMDFIVHGEHRGHGVGAWALERILEYPPFAGTRFMLVTKDAQAYYRKSGFETHPFECMIRWE